MTNEVQLRIRKKFANQYKSGFPLILKDAVINIDELKEEGTLVDLIDDAGRFLSRGYHGLQNKGYGWVLTNNRQELIDQKFFDKTLGIALTQRKPFFDSDDTTAFRVFNGEGDGIGGVTIDHYADYYLINWYSEGIYAFKDEILQALKTSVAYKGIYEKKRFKRGGKYIEDDDFVAGERADFPLIVKENGVSLAVDLNDGPMTGVFLDQREVRKTLRDHYAAGKTVLNTFSYTGAFSVFAALGGAETTISVDLANRSLDKTKEQFEINSLDPEAHEIRVMDVFNYFRYAVRNDLQFDVTVLDPPSFARSKKHTFSVSKDYKNLIKDAISVTKQGGVIIASTNFSGFGMGKFKGFADDAFKESGLKYEIEKQFSLPKDFKTHPSYKESNYLKVLVLRVK